MTPFTPDDIGTGRALTSLVHHCAARITFTAVEVEEWRWQVYVMFNGRTLEAEIAALKEPSAVNVVSALWGMTEYVSLPDSNDRRHWQPMADACKRVFGPNFGKSPKLPVGATFALEDGTVWRVIMVGDRRGRAQRAIAQVQQQSEEVKI